MNLCQISLFISHPNSSTNSLSVYLLSLAAYLNSCTYFSITLLHCSTCFNSATFFDSLSPLPKLFFISSKNSSTISNFIFLLLDLPTHFFYTSADFPCTYVNIHCICSSTIDPFIKSICMLLQILLLC